MSAIVAMGLKKSYGETPVLAGVDLTVAPGEVVAIIGPSGSGKSTLLRCLAGLEPINAGDLTIAGVTPSVVSAMAQAPAIRTGVRPVVVASANGNASATAVLKDTSTRAFAAFDIPRTIISGDASIPETWPSSPT